jgi:putative hydrolase of the HAD superfamily
MIDASLKAVFFDAVGTLISPRAPVSRTYVEFARRHGAEVDEERMRQAFREAFVRQEKVDSHDGWRTDEARERLRWQSIVEEVLAPLDAGPCFGELWDWFSRPEAWCVEPQAGDVLGELDRRGMTLGIASNFDGRLQKVLAGFTEFAPLRDRCVISSLVGWRKPAKEFFQAVAHAAGCVPGEILYVGDDLRNDIHGATSAGLRAVLFDPEGRGEGGQRVRQMRDLLAGSGFIAETPLT